MNLKMDHTMDMTQTSTIFNDKCLITGEKMHKILDFGMHPYADTFLSENHLHLSEPVFPLECFLNPNSGQIQLGYITNAYDRYNLYAYSYTSSNSSFAKKHWNLYHDTLLKKYNINNSTVIEIGANDGYLSHLFLKENNKVISIDSSKEMCELAKNRGLIVYNQLFDFQFSNEIIKAHDKANLVIANNVFNHSNFPVDFAKGVCNMLSQDGVFVFELPYWGSTYESDKFDQVYHEHVSYFTVKSSYNLLKIAGLDLIDFEIVDYHGGSIRVYAKKSLPDYANNKIFEAIKKEEELGLFDIETYKNWQKKLLSQRDIFLRNLYTLKVNNPDTPIIGVGAAAKANTFLNYYCLNKSVISFITDSSIHKQGKYTPLTRIPVVDDSIFSTFPKVFALILSWNISNDLKEVLKKVNPNIKFINIHNENN